MATRSCRLPTRRSPPTSSFRLIAVQTSRVDGNPLYSQSQSIDLGPLGATKPQDTPYTVNIVPRGLIENQQLKNVQDALCYIPSVQSDGARPQSRGLQGSVVQITRIDGLNVVGTTDYPAEQFDHIEVLDGLSSAIYGPTNPAGTFNYVLKRPTPTQLATVRLGISTGGAFLRHGRHRTRLAMWATA